MRPTIDAPKDAWRRWALDRRRARTDHDIAAARAAITAHLLTRLSGRRGVCCYLPLCTEPLDPELPAALVASGTRVLVPVTRADAPLGWAEYRIDDLLPVGPFGIDEPTGPQVGRGEGLDGVDVVLVPALLVDSRGGRLGRGGGHYDRSFAGQLGRVPLRIAVLFDDELVAALPVAEFDMPVHAVVTPSGGVQEIAH